MVESRRGNVRPEPCLPVARGLRRRDCSGTFQHSTAGRGHLGSVPAIHSAVPRFNQKFAPPRGGWPRRSQYRQRRTMHCASDRSIAKRTPCATSSSSFGRISPLSLLRASRVRPPSPLLIIVQRMLLNFACGDIKLTGHPKWPTAGIAADPVFAALSRKSRKISVFTPRLRPLSENS